MRKPYNWDDLVYFLRKKHRMNVGRAIVRVQAGELTRAPAPQPQPPSQAAPVQAAPVQPAPAPAPAAHAATTLATHKNARLT